MADGYESLEPWYEHLYASLHGLLREALASPSGMAQPRALDVGCGTGFQTAILREMGYVAHGLDLSGALLRGARERLPVAALVQGDALALPYRDGAFDAVACCGSTLSYVDDAGRALAEIARVLEPSGRLFVECEGRPSLDLAWAGLSAALGDPLGYEVSAGEIWRAAMTPRDRECRMRYPGYGTLRLFNAAELDRLLRGAGLVPVRTWGIHSITNLLPSTMLHRERLGRGMSAIYRALCRADRAMAARWPATRMANSLVALARRA